MTGRHKTFQGREFNMTAFAEKNGDVRAVGNVNMNARGDILDEKGKVKVKTGQIAKGVSDIAGAQTSKQVSIKTDEAAQPIKKTAVKADVIRDVEAVEAPVELDEFAEPEPTVLSRKDLGNGTEEVEYSDGSMEVLAKSE